MIPLNSLESICLDKCLALNDCSNLMCKLSRWLTRQNRFPHYTDIFLHAHFGGENAKFVQLTLHLPCFVKELHLEINYKN